MVEPRVDVAIGRCGRRAWCRRSTGAAAVVVAVCGLWSPGLAVAATAGVTLQYTCTVGAPMTAQVRWSMPPEIVVGTPTPAVTVTATATISAADAELFGLVGVASVDGSGDTAGAVLAPEGTINAALHLVVPPTPVPTSGPMTFRVAGTTPSLVFHQPGHAVVDVGTALDLTLTARDAKGNPIEGPTSVSCALDPGQNPEVSSFDIMPAPSAIPTPTTRTAVPHPNPFLAPGTRGSGMPGAGSSGGGSSGPGAAGVGRSPSSTGGSTTAGPTVSSDTSSTTLPPTSATATREQIRDSAAVSSRRGLPVGWWLPVVGTMVVLVGSVGGVRWLLRRRRAPGR